MRAQRISDRLQTIIDDRSVRDPTVTVVEAEGASELHVGPHLLMVITPRDAAAIGAPRTSVAEQYAQILEAAIRQERLRYSPGMLLRSGVIGAVATVVFLLACWAILRVTGALRRRLADRLAARAEALGVIDPDGVSADTLSKALGALLLVVRALLVLVLLDYYLTFVLGLFPWTAALSTRLLGYAFSPVRAVVLAIVGYLPKLLFLIVIGGVVSFAIRLVRVFFRQIETGRLVFAKFPPEWADPTNKIVRVLLIAFGLVVAFPYLPASDSPAFTGVSVFMGVLVSLASSSALSNMIAGIVLTYTGAFKLGDRVRIGDAFGDIIETTLLATRVRTIKNEDVTIPNSIALGSAVTNYSREARTLGLILHTSVTIGYDAPWRKVHDLLIGAALGTPGLLREPQPFVWQTALNDFYVTYEINAYTAVPKDMIDTYALLHARIQDAFYAAGVEIMSPHVTSIRDGNTVAIPEAQRPPGYQPGSFRVSDAAAAAAARPPTPRGA
jgi:small-conductance mechanosensitive channel